MRRRTTGAILRRGSSDVLEISSNGTNSYFSENARPTRSIFPTLVSGPRERLIILLVSEKHSPRGTLCRMSSKTWTSLWVSQIIYPGTSYARRSRETFASIAKQTRRIFFQTRVFGNFLRTRRRDSPPPISLYLTSLKRSRPWTNNFHFARDKRSALQKKEIPESIEN